MLTPKVVDMIKEMFKIQPSKYPAGAGLAAPFNVLMQAASTIVTLKQFWGKP